MKIGDLREAESDFERSDDGFATLNHILHFLPRKIAYDFIYGTGGILYDDL